VLPLEALRKSAELNLCQKCYPVYLHQLEPFIEEQITAYFYDWQGIESYVRGLALWHLDAFKTHLFVNDFDEYEPQEVMEFLDIDKFLAFRNKYRGIRSRMEYLHNEKIIGDNFFALLIELAKRRNKIHRVNTNLSESTRAAFGRAYTWLQWIYIVNVDSGMGGDMRERRLKEIELSARALFAKLSDEKI